ncbi:FAD binding domain-containing protein [Escherichia coli]
MIEQFFRPDSVEQALELKRRYQDEAVWFAGGSKLNATPTRTDKKIAISLQDLELDWVDWDNGALRIGAMSRCSHCVMRDLFLQHCVKPSVLLLTPCS